jgi:ABC-type glycerol-3-phosphate transport system substrate-binding protein
MERYPSFMLDDLMTESEDSNGKKWAALWGIPLGYETLWMYYNKSILPTPPTSWDEMDMLIQNNEQPVVLFWLWLGPRYIPESADIIASLSSASSYTGLSSAWEWGLRYMKYAHMQWRNKSPEGTPEDLYAPRSALSSWMTMYDLIPEMKTQNGEIELTVYDLFMRWKVWAIFSYPSRIRELELSKKRAWSDTSASLILTAPFPTLGNDEKKSRVLASYWYFAISSKTKNGISAGQFMNYLTTEEAQAKFIESFPTYIAAQTSFVAWQRDTPLSSSFSRARLGNFIVPWEKVYSFQYGIRKEFDSYLHEYMDFTENPPKNMLDKIAKWVQCQLDHLRGENMETVCEK